MGGLESWSWFFLGRTRFGPFSEHVDGLEWGIGGLSCGGMCVLVLFWKLQVRSWRVECLGWSAFLYGFEKLFLRCGGVKV